MKKFIIALIVLIAILSTSVMSIKSFKKSSNEIVAMVEITYDLVTNHRWKEASDEISKVETKWNKTENFWAMLIDHMEIDCIEESLTKSKNYIETQNISLSLAELDTLKFAVEHIYKKELVNLKNVL
jgi:hypothetical protein